MDEVSPKYQGNVREEDLMTTKIIKRFRSLKRYLGFKTRILSMENKKLILKKLNFFFGSKQTKTYLAN